MAALQKIRNRGALLIIVIGLAMFAFIAGDLFNSIETSFNSKRMQVGEVCGEDLSVQDYQDLVAEATNAYKMQGEVNDQQVRDEVWGNFVSQTIIKNETDELGLIVTDEEVQNALRAGKAQALRALPFFFNQQTGRFDVAALQNFLKQYKELGAQAASMPADQLEQYQMIYDLWVYAEKNLRQELLMNKFNALIQNSFISNPVAAEMQFKANTERAEVEYVALPYASVADSLVTPTDSELKAMYKKNKDLFFMDAPTRDIKYIDVTVRASAADRAALNKKMDEIYARLMSESAADVVNSSNSQSAYVDLALSKTAFPSDVQKYIDTMKVGSVKLPYYNAADNTMNVIKLIAKAEMPDSVLCRAIAVSGATEAEAAQRADSVKKALAAGAKYADVAANYGQPSDSSWITAAQYEGYNLAENDLKYIKAVTSTAKNGIGIADLGQNKLVIQVLDRKAVKTKYNAAVVKCVNDFSKTTYREALGKFNRFLSENHSLEDIEKNAMQNGYIVRTLNDVVSSAHNVANVSSTSDVIRWIFDEAEVGSVSRLYECGNNDHLLLVAVTGIHDDEYRAWDDARVKETLSTMVKNEKKAAIVMERMKAAGSMDAAKALDGVVVDSLSISFGQSPYVAAAMAPEAVLSGAAAKTEAGQCVGPLQGGSAAFMVQVASKNTDAVPYDAKAALQEASMFNMRIAGQQLFEALFLDADVVDNRYKF